ncbi:MAG: glyceraldehyde 3-phosphate dehydrogenase NAD-binding domain-containing protein [Acidaminobacteraceae bacterium]
MDFILNDSTYGSLERLMYGYSKNNFNIEILNRDENEVTIDGKFVKFLMDNRNPKDIKWAENSVEIVCDCTGVFLNPEDISSSRGSLRGHIETTATTEMIATSKDTGIELTHAKIFGWYDNEFGSYVNSLSNIIIHMDKELLKTFSINSHILKVFSILVKFILFK